MRFNTENRSTIGMEANIYKVQCYVMYEARCTSVNVPATSALTLCRCTQPHKKVSVPNVFPKYIQQTLKYIYEANAYTSICHLPTSLVCSKLFPLYKYGIGAANTCLIDACRLLSHRKQLIFNAVNQGGIFEIELSIVCSSFDAKVSPHAQESRIRSRHDPN